MKEIKDYNNRALWYALYLCIVKKFSANDALNAMGEKVYNYSGTEEN